MELTNVNIKILLVLFLTCFITVISSNNSTEDKKCYPIHGCFAMGEPWSSLLRPIPAPMSPEEIQTRIYFYSRPETKVRHEISLHPTVKLNGAPFDRSLPTAFITHGFSSNGNASWLTGVKDAYLSRINGNVMLVDWGPGASLLNYLQVSGNTRVVGTEIARLVTLLNIDPKKLHLIGHSLGSHISAYAAKQIKGTARITALDPAQPAFEGFDPAVRLDSSDAEFVDVIHTDARPFIPSLGLGMIAPVGHVDFYINGGFDQPGCLLPDPTKIPKITSLLDLAKFPVEVISGLVACPHGRAYEYFLESLNGTDKCIFWGHKATVRSVLKSVVNTLSQGVATRFTSLSPTCTRNDCTPLGLRTKLSALRGTFVVTTKGRSPYCISEKDVPPELFHTPDVIASPVKKIMSRVIDRLHLGKLSKKK